MIRIAVVDDENNICSYVESCLLNFSKKYSVNIEVDVFSSGEDLINTINETFYDVIFLDIMMEGLSGIDISRLIRITMKNEATQIVYISGNTEYAIEVFDYDPFHFLPKPLSKEKIEKAFVKLIHKLSLKSEAFSYKSGYETMKVTIKDIIYFESDDHQIKIHYYLQNFYKKDYFYGSLDHVQDQLKSYRFLRIHKTYLINPLHIKKYTYEKIQMSTEVILPIAQSKRKEIRAEQFKL